MKLTPHRPDTMGLYVTGQDQYGNYLSMWRTIHNPSEYQSALDDVAIVSYLSNALQHDVGDTEAIENYFKSLDFLKLPSDELEDFAVYCGDILFENSPATLTSIVTILTMRSIFTGNNITWLTV